MRKDVWPFEAWLRVAVGRFGLTPSEFWACSVCDWMTLLEPPQESRVSRGDLEALSKLYPDGEGDNDRV